MDAAVIRMLFEQDSKTVSTNEPLLRSRKWTVLACEFPIFVLRMVHPRSGTEYCFRFSCDSYPVSMQVVNPTTFQPVTAEKWPKGGSFHTSHSDPNTGPFLCAPGIREYHTHNSHMNETKWVFSDASFRLPQILDTVFVHLGRANE